MPVRDWGLVLCFKRYLQTVNPLKIVVFLCLAFAACVTLPDQTLELYRYTAQALAESYASVGASRSHFGDTQGLIGLVVLATSVLLLSLVFLVLAAYVHTLHVSHPPDDNQFSASPFSTIACVPGLAVAAGLILALPDPHAENVNEVMLTGARLSFAKDFLSSDRIEQLSQRYVEAQLQVNWWLYFMAVVCGAIALGMFFLSRLCLRTLLTLTARTKATPLLVMGFGLPVVLSIIFVLSPVWFARTLSSFGVLCLFFATASLLLAALALLESRARMPLLFLLIVCAVIFSVFGLNDNHTIRTTRTSKDDRTLLLPQRAISDGFTQWLDGRKDRDRYDTYPVYIVATEGGGIYAAFRTASFLASLQDRCPRFSQHVFAISSVSGGSVGAAVFNGLTRKIKQSDERFKAGSGCRKKGENVGGLFFTDVAEEIFQDDFLAPVLGAFLFPDFLQRFLFFPIKQFDRSIALEKSIEESWAAKVQYYYTRFKDRWIDERNPLSASFSTSWSPQTDAPALLINTTEVGSGRGRIISPFLVNTNEFSSFPLPNSAGTNQHSHDISMSTAAVLSARFPWLTPPGSFRTTSTASKNASPLNVQLVDGGYFDNSGVTLALTVIREIEAAVAKLSPSPKIQITLIVLTSAGFGDPSGLVSDYFAPFQTLLSTRSARGEIAVKEAKRVFATSVAARSPFRSLGEVELRGYGYPLPLGWRLSPITRLLILGQSGNAVGCQQDGGSKCLLENITDELNR
jgi:hypothetical protein